MGTKTNVFPDHDLEKETGSYHAAAWFRDCESARGLYTSIATSISDIRPNLASNPGSPPRPLAIMLRVLVATVRSSQCAWPWGLYLSRLFYSTESGTDLDYY